jgi:HEAT repeat protein
MRFIDWLFNVPPNTWQLLRRKDEAGLVAALGHSLPWVRRNAAENLGTLRLPQSATALTLALDDPDQEVRYAARAALDDIQAVYERVPSI